MPASFSVQHLDDAVRFLASHPTPKLGFVLGSGLGSLAKRVESATVIPYGEIPHMPRPTVHGHGGELVLGKLGGTTVALLSGRAHLYEGHEPEVSTFAVRVLARWGVGAVVLTNAAGGIAPELTPGSLMAITDHLNLTGKNPLVGVNPDEVGPRFPDMTAAYDPELLELLLRAALRENVNLERGVYAGLLGPTYETPAEIRMLKTLGAAAVGMSTVLETIALRHFGVRVAGVSCVTNKAAGLGQGTLSHEEVAEVAAKSRERFETLLTTFAEFYGRSLGAT